MSEIMDFEEDLGEEEYSGFRIEDDKISIYDGGAEAAYVTGHKLHVTEVDVSASLNIGNYALIPRAGGNLSFMKVR